MGYGGRGGKKWQRVGAKLVFNLFHGINAKIAKKAGQTRLIKVESYCGLGRKYRESNPSGLPRFHAAQNKDFELRVPRGQLSVTRARVCICSAKSWTRNGSELSIDC